MFWCWGWGDAVFHLLENDGGYLGGGGGGGGGGTYKFLSMCRASAMQATMERTTMSWRMRRVKGEDWMSRRGVWVSGVEASS